MNRYSIVLFKSFEKTNFYTIHKNDKEFNETDDFFLRFKDSLKHIKDVETIKYFISKIGNEFGAQPRHFRFEGKARALPILSSKLRLYCLHVNENIVILGNGGKKTSKKVQDSPDAFPHFTLINKIALIFRTKLKSGEITISDKCINGDLSFFTNN